MKGGKRGTGLLNSIEVMTQEEEGLPTIRGNGITMATCVICFSEMRSHHQHKSLTLGNRIPFTHSVTTSCVRSSSISFIAASHWIQ